MNQADWLPQTKFLPPLVGSDILARPTLVRRLQAAVADHPLTLISAPAGSGKTTLVAQWLAQENKGQTAWFRLNDDDNDPATFLLGLVTSIRQAIPTFKTSIDDLTNSMPNMQTRLRHFSGLLCNDIVETVSDRLGLVIDDLHTLTNPTILEALNYLVDHCPPQLSIVIASRYDPPLALARLRARGQLAEFRLNSLQFTAKEIRDLLNQQLPLALSESDLDMLQSKTGGWAASLRLLAISLNQANDSARRSTFISHLAQTERHIFDFLAEEVLQEQPPQIRQFLLETSILDALTPTLCRAVTARRDAGQTLDGVFRRNLFLTAVTGGATSRGEPVYRYHDLFASFLRQRLEQENPAAVLALHRRVAEVHPLPEEAVKHYMAGELWEEAADVLEELGQMQIERRFLRSHTVDAILALPDETRQGRPWLLLTVGALYVQRGDERLSAPLLDRALTLFRQAGDEQGEIDTLLTELQRRASVDAHHVIDLAEKMASSSHLVTPANQANYHVLAQWYHDLHHDWPQLTHHFSAGLALARRHPQRGGPAWIMALAFGPALLFNDEGMAASEQFAYQLADLATEEDWVANLGSNMILAWIRFYQGRVEETEQVIKQAHRYTELIGGLGWIDFHIEWQILILLLLRRRYGRFEKRIQKVLAMVSEQGASRALLPGFLYLQLRAFWLENRLAEAKLVLARLRDPDMVHLFTTVDQVATALSEGLLAQAEKRYPEAERHFLAAVELHRRVRHTVRLTYPRLSLATLYQQWGRPDQALAELTASLTDIRQQGKPGIVLQEGHSIVPLLESALEQGIEREMVRSLLASFTPPEVTQSLAVPGTNEILTPREVEVLRLIATGASNKEIAEQLVISTWTVKSHVTKILAKLSVSSRTQAAARVRELDLPIS